MAKKSEEEKVEEVTQAEEPAVEENPKEDAQVEEKAVVEETPESEKAEEAPEEPQAEDDTHNTESSTLGKAKTDNKVQQEEAKDMTDAEQVVVFTLAGEEYAVPILDVQEIIPTGEITPFPNVADYIEGIINVRGTIATVINLSKKFSLEADKDEKQNQYIILTQINGSLFGMMVGEVSSVMKIAKSDMKKNEGMTESKVHTEYISNVAVVNDRVILILKFNKILDDKESKELASKTEQA